MFGGFPFDFCVSAAAAFFFGDFLSGDGVSSLLGVLVVLGWLWGYESLAFFFFRVMESTWSVGFTFVWIAFRTEARKWRLW